MSQEISCGQMKLTYQVDIRRGLSDTFSRGGIPTQPPYVKNSDSPQLL